VNVNGTGGQREGDPSHNLGTARGEKKKERRQFRSGKMKSSAAFCRRKGSEGRWRSHNGVHSTASLKRARRRTEKGGGGLWPLSSTGIGKKGIYFAPRLSNVGGGKRVFF